MVLKVGSGFKWQFIVPTTWRSEKSTQVDSPIHRKNEFIFIIVFCFDPESRDLRVGSKNKRSVIYPFDEWVVTSPVWWTHGSRGWGCCCIFFIYLSSFSNTVRQSVFFWVVSFEGIPCCCIFFIYLSSFSNTVRLNRSPLVFVFPPLYHPAYRFHRLDRLVNVNSNTDSLPIASPPRVFFFLVVSFEGIPCCCIFFHLSFIVFEYRTA